MWFFKKDYLAVINSSNQSGSPIKKKELKYGTDKLHKLYKQTERLSLFELTTAIVSK